MAGQRPSKKEEHRSKAQHHQRQQGTAAAMEGVRTRCNFPVTLPRRQQGEFQPVVLVNTAEYREAALPYLSFACNICTTP